MVKIVLSAMILAAGMAAGVLKGRVCINRERDIDDIIRSMILFKNEMSFSGLLISDICRRVAGADVGRMSDFLLYVAELLECRSVNSLSEAWSDAAEKIYKNGCLSEADIRILTEIGFDLGNKTISEHIPLFERAVSLLSLQKAEAASDIASKVRLYRILGFSASALVVIAVI